MFECTRVSFVYVVLRNGSLKHDTKAADGGGLALSPFTVVVGKVEEKNYDRKWGSSHSKRIFQIEKKIYYFTNYHISILYEVHAVEVEGNIRRGFCYRFWMLAPQLPGINMLKGRQMNFPFMALKININT